MDIYLILSSKKHDKYYLQKYINFIRKNLNKYPEKFPNSELHHICPKAKDMFPQYKDYSFYKWNKIVLPIKKHFYAHYLLTKAFYWSKTQNEAFCLMGGRLKNKNLLFLINEYHKGIIQRGKNHSIRMKGMVSVKDAKSGKRLLVSKEEFEQNGDFVGITKGKFTGEANVSKRKEVKDKISKLKSGRITVLNKTNNKIEQIRKEHFNPEKYEIRTGFSGRVNYIIKLRDGSTKSITFDDPLYQSNDYVSANSKYIVTIKIGSKEIQLNNEYSRNQFIDEMQENLKPTHKMPDDYKTHPSGKFMFKKTSVSLFFMKS